MTRELDGVAEFMHGQTMSPRRALLAVAVLFAVGEALDSIDVGLIGLVFAALFAVGAYLMHRETRTGLVLVGTLIVIEVAAWPTFKRNTATDWLIQVPFLCVGVFGLIALAALLFRERRSASGT
jgi:hypothetical protein